MTSLFASAVLFIQNYDQSQVFVKKIILRKHTLKTRKKSFQQIDK